jgi:probable RNA-binding protein EIF1AD
MAGLGRRTHYRKHLTDSVLHDLPEPKENERIAKVVATRGGNQFDILVAESESTTTNNADDVKKNTPQLAILPTKFHKLVWVKRNDYILVETGDAEKQENDETGVRFIISHILYKDQVKHLKSKRLWPEHDPEFSSAPGEEADFEDDDDEEEDDGIVYQTGYENDEDDDADLFVNTNRIVRMEVQDSEEESSDEG